jgi:hypothetical protein
MPTPARQKKKNFYESKTRRAEVSAVREVLLMKKFPLFFALLLALRALPALAAADGGGPGDGGAKAAGRNQAEADDGEDDDDGDAPPPVVTIVPVAFFALILAIVGASYYTRFRIERQKHETVRLIVEKGGAIPPELLAPPRPARSDLRRGILLASAGLAIAVCFALVAPAGIGLGVIPFTIGLGYLLIWKLDSRNE